MNIRQLKDENRYATMLLAKTFCGECRSRSGCTGPAI